MTMTSNRFRRILRARWWVLAIIVLIAVAVATMFVNARNDSIPEREATAGISFLRLVGELDDTELQQRLADASQIAIEVNSSQISTGVDPLLPGALAEIVPDALFNRLLFFGRGETDAAASGLAVELRNRYLQAQPLDNSTEIERRISQTTVQLDDVVALITEATEEPPIDEGEIARRAKIRELQAEVSALTSRYGALTVELITPSNPPRETAGIEAERGAIRRQLKATEEELRSLQTAEVEAAPEDSGIALLRSEETQLRLLLDDLVAQRIADEPFGTLDPIETQSSGIDELSALSVQTLALFLGLFIGLAGLVLLDRSRRPVWATADLQPEFRLPEIAKRPHSSGHDTSQSWYPIAPQGKRKAGIQQLRSHVEGLHNFGSGLTIGIASLGSGSRDVHELAADLAASISGSGTRALLIDADFDDPTDLSEFRRSGCDLKMALDDPTGCLSQADPDTDQSSVSGISISRKILDSPDILARPGFADLLSAAKYEYGVIIIACPPSSTAGYHVLTQRLDSMILVSEIGGPLPNELESALGTLEDRRARPLGVVLLTASDNPLRAVVDRIPGGLSFRQATGKRSKIQEAEDGTRQQQGAEMPETVATAGTGSDAHVEKTARSAGFRVDIVSGSNPVTSDTSDDGGSHLRVDDSPAQAGSTSFIGDDAASTEATNAAGQAPNSETLPAPSAANQRTSPGDTTGPDTAEVSSIAEADDPVSEPISSSRTPDRPLRYSDATDSQDGACESSDTTDATVSTEVTDQKSLVSPPPGSKGKKSDPINSAPSDTEPRKSATNGGSRARRRNAKGQFLSAEPSQTTSVDEATTQARKTRTTTVSSTSEARVSEASSNTVSKSDNSSDATN